MMLPEKKQYFPLCYLEIDVEVTIANQACNSLMCIYIESSLISKSYCNKGQKCCEKFSMFFRNRMEIAVLCLVYSITYPRVHPLRTLASDGITVQSPSKWGWSKVLVNGVVLSWLSVIGPHKQIKIRLPVYWRSSSQLKSEGRYQFNS